MQETTTATATRTRAPKVEPVAFRMTWAELMDYNDATVATAAEYDAILAGVAHLVGPGGGYIKTGFEITFADGFKYTGRIDVLRAGDWRNERVMQHVAAHVGYASGLVRPSHISETDYAGHLAAIGEPASAFMYFVARDYAVGVETPEDRMQETDPTPDPIGPGSVVVRETYGGQRQAGTVRARELDEHGDGEAYPVLVVDWNGGETSTVYPSSVERHGLDPRDPDPEPVALDRNGERLHEGQSVAIVGEASAYRGRRALVRRVSWGSNGPADGVLVRLSVAREAGNADEAAAPDGAFTTFMHPQAVELLPAPAATLTNDTADLDQRVEVWTPANLYPAPYQGETGTIRRLDRQPAGETTRLYAGVELDGYGSELLYIPVWQLIDEREPAGPGPDPDSPHAAERASIGPELVLDLDAEPGPSQVAGELAADELDRRADERADALADDEPDPYAGIPSRAIAHALDELNPGPPPWANETRERIAARAREIHEAGRQDTHPLASYADPLLAADVLAFLQRVEEMQQAGPIAREAVALADRITRQNAGQ